MKLRRACTGGGPFELRVRHFEDADALPSGDVIGELYDSSLDVAVVSGALDPDELGPALNRLDHDDELLWTPQSRPVMDRADNLIFGNGLAPNGVDPGGPSADHYLACAARFVREAQDVFAGLDLFERIHRVLDALAGPHPARLARAPDGRGFSPFTVRGVAPGNGFGLHAGNFFYGTPAYDGLRDQLDQADQISFFVPLRAAESGGELEIFSLRWGDPDIPTAPGQLLDAAETERRFSSVVVELEVGEMIVFDGGRLFHRVTEVGGPHTRWTLGGFAARSRAGDALLYWA